MGERIKKMLPPTEEHTLIQDIFLGAVQGDFAQEIGGAGRLTQVVLAFVPGIGSICAFRDMLADWQYDDKVGATLNAIAILPFVGSVSKLAAVFRAARRMSRIMKAARALRQPAEKQPRRSNMPNQDNNLV